MWKETSLVIRHLLEYTAKIQDNPQYKYPCDEIRTGTSRTKVGSLPLQQHCLKGLTINHLKHLTSPIPYAGAMSFWWSVRANSHENVINFAYNFKSLVWAVSEITLRPGLLSDIGLLKQSSGHGCEYRTRKTPSKIYDTINEMTRFKKYIRPSLIKRTQ